MRRFLRTRALVGLDDLTARYPIEPALAVEILERWSLEGGLVRIDDDGAHPRWAERRNLAEVRRLSVALSRRESVAVRPEVFAHFLLLRQGVHPSSRRQGRSAVERTLEQLQGFAASSGMWETALLPRRVADYRPAWLDEALASGDWTWRAQGEGSGETRVAFASREFAGPWPDSDPVGDGLAKAEAQVLDHLRHRGASFVADIARATGLEPSRVRSLLDKLMRMGLVINDRFDPLRPGADRTAEALAAASSAAMARSPRLGRLRPSLRSLRSHHPEGRWSLVGASESDDEEAAALAWASVLLDRFGVLARETAALDTWAPPWRALATVLDRAEWRGEVRRGYFVEGLSGVQYALDETAEALARLAGAAEDREPVLIATVDPANLYGAGAPFDLPLLEGGTARLNRSATNFLVLSAGRPVLIVEASGARLTGLAAASEAQLRSALALLPTLAGPSRRILKVATYNRAPVLASPAVPWLAEVGFVRDYAGMTYYASGW